MVAQTALDKFRAERPTAEERVRALAAEHTALTQAITAIRNKFRDAA
jgi:hypothetical protein